MVRVSEYLHSLSTSYIFYNYQRQRQHGDDAVLEKLIHRLGLTSVTRYNLPYAAYLFNL